ncbi:hypothetical protein C8J57DRAFT_1098634 [Mycena rebaudengoi]|nr:hypothetical protein C8J57DRAFT_1098634 [Mycena rebaudengoi]
MFMQGHRQVDTHMSRFRVEPVVLVLLGPTLPRGDGGDTEREKWARSMMILFKPWRTLSDLKSPDQTWLQAFDATHFSENIQQLMKNINVEHECKDAKDEYESLRRAGRVRNLIDGSSGGPSLQPGDCDSLAVALMNDPLLDADDDAVDGDNTPDLSGSVSNPEAVIKPMKNC